jgi:hypothetical protein
LIVICHNFLLNKEFKAERAGAEVAFLGLLVKDFWRPDEENRDE